MSNVSSSGSNINLTISDAEDTPLTNSTYDNSKTLRRDLSSSFYEQARSPSEILSSIYNDFTWPLARDLVLSVGLFILGINGKMIVHNFIIDLNVRPIPYQTTAVGDVLIDLTLGNDMIPKTDVTFNCEYYLGVRCLISYLL